MNQKPILTPESLVTTLLKRDKEELRLKKRLIIFLDKILFLDAVRNLGALKNPAWDPLRRVYDLRGRDTVLIRALPSSPNLAMVLEEAHSFGVEEVILIGLCGSISDTLRIGDILVAEGGISDEGTSKHYFEKESVFRSNWFDIWKERSAEEGFKFGYVWTTDAPYRETREKVERFKNLGAVCVDMEVAAFYAVSNFLELKSIAFLLVSDELFSSRWIPGFFSPQFVEGRERLLRFMLRFCII